MGHPTMLKTLFKGMVILSVTFGLTACSGIGQSSGGGLFRAKTKVSDGTKLRRAQNPLDGAQAAATGEGTAKKRNTIWDLFSTPDQNINVRVNKYLWNAALETLSFLPVESADPFTGVLVMGWGRAPGGSRQYRATVLVQDPALDARSLKLAIQTRGGPASTETIRQIEDVIMTRARQLRIRDKNL